MMRVRPGPGPVPRRVMMLSLVVGVGLGCPKESTHPEPSPPSPVAQTEPSTDVAAARTLPSKDPDDDATAVGTHGAVSSAEANASQIGVEIMQRGGNAVDAAVAVGLALSVTHPSAANIGGGGFMIVREPDGNAVAIDYREMAPSKSGRDMYLDKKGNPTAASIVGPKAAGIPGDVAGFAFAHRKYGKLPWSELVAPAIALAEEGWVLDEFHARDLEGAVGRMKAAADNCTKSGKPKKADPNSWIKRVPIACKIGGPLHQAFEYSAAYFEKSPGTTYATGDRWKQPDLAQTLREVQKGGEHFYEGPLADAMAEKVQSLGGIWLAEDLANYEAVERKPLIFQYRGHEIIAMPPPSAGGIVLRLILAASEALELYAMDWDTTKRVHYYVETLRRTYADRNLLLGDPDFVDIPTAQLMDVSYMPDRVSDVDPGRATPSSEVGAGVEVKESRQTTHFSVVDASGLAVSNTYTLNGGFGAKLVLEGTGVILNNEMDDFTAKVGSPNMFGLVQGAQNGIEPGKRMLSSMTPTIIAKDGELRAIVGSPGGPTITTTVAQIVMQLIDHDRTISEAVAAPRVHHQWLPDIITYEQHLDGSIVEELRGMGHELREVPWRAIGHANCIEVDPETKGFRAVADITRDGGKAVAY